MADLAPAASAPASRTLMFPQRRPRARSHSVTFPELVHVHLRWRRALETGSHLREADEQYHTALGSFERQHGKVVNSYWCTSAESAVALTARPRSRLLRLLGLADSMRFHRVSDWATKDHPEIAAPLHECDELAIKASTVLVGKSRLVAMQLVMASAGHLLSLVDERSGHGNAAKTSKALAVQRKELAHTRSYLRQAANGEAQIVYVFGMTLGIAGLGLLVGLLGAFVDSGTLDRRDLLGSLVAGGLGALVSVMSRISGGHFSLASDFGARYPLFLGLLRPLIGSVFGLAIYFLFASGLVKISDLPPKGGDPNTQLYFYAALAFIAGFSERWARDMLLGSRLGGGAEQEQENAAQPGSGTGGKASPVARASKT